MGGRKMLELRLGASATPPTVARATQMLAEVVGQAFRRRPSR